MADDATQTENQSKPKSKMMLIIIIAVVTALLAGGGVAAYFLLGAGGGENAEAEPAAEPHAPAFYYDFKPPFIVNFQVKGRRRFVQVALSVLTRNETVVKALEQHMPLIRNNLLMTFSAQDFETLRTPEGKEALRQAVLEEIQKVLTEETGEPGVEQVLYTNFVVQ